MTTTECISSVLNEEDRNRIRRDNVFNDDENDRMCHDGGKKKQTTTECALPMFNGQDVERMCLDDV